MCIRRDNQTDYKAMGQKIAIKLQGKGISALLAKKRKGSSSSTQAD